MTLIGATDAVNASTEPSTQNFNRDFTAVEFTF
jgi:hypothetical protein